MTPKKAVAPKTPQAAALAVAAAAKVSKPTQSSKAAKEVVGGGGGSGSGGDHYDNNEDVIVMSDSDDDADANAGAVADPMQDAPAGGSVECDADVLRAWRAECPELRALWGFWTRVGESQPVTGWRGVTFGRAGSAHAGRVLEIYLDGKGLTGDVPAALGGLTALTALNLPRNKLTSVPAALGQLTALTRLVLDGNQLTSVPAELGNLLALEAGAYTRSLE